MIVCLDEIGQHSRIMVLGIRDERDCAILVRVRVFFLAVLLKFVPL